MRVHRAPESDAVGPAGTQTGAYWEKFWRNFRTHHAKYGVGLATLSGGFPEWFRKQILDEFAELVIADQALKFAALYVDSTNGDVSTPTASIASHHAKNAVDWNTEAIKSFADFWRDVDFAQVIANTEPKHAPVSAAAASANAEELAGLIHELVALGKPGL